jgi:hypothetical protein
VLLNGTAKRTKNSEYREKNPHSHLVVAWKSDSVNFGNLKNLFPSNNTFMP